MDRVLFELHRVQLGQELVGEPGAGEEPEAVRRVVDQEQLRQLVADALRAHDLQAVRVLDDGTRQLRHGFEPEVRDEARRPHHPQRVVEERDLGRQRGAQPVRGEIRDSPVGIDELRLGQRQCHRVHGEVAPGEVGRDVVAEGHLRLARIRVVHLGPEGGDLHPHPPALAPDGAEPLPLQPDRVGPAPDDTLDLVGAGVGRQVDVRRGPVEEGVPHAPAHEVALVPRVREARRGLLHRRVDGEERGEAGRDVGHRSIVAVGAPRRSMARPSGRIGRSGRPDRPDASTRGPQPGQLADCTGASAASAASAAAASALAASARVISSWSIARRRSCGCVAVAIASRRLTRPFR